MKAVLIRSAAAATVALAAVVTMSAQRPPRLTVGGDVKEPVKLVDVRPDYPQAAKDQEISGMVLLTILIGTDGVVLDAEVIRSVHPLLDNAAAAAILKWKYRPTEVNGEAVELVMTVTVNFVLPKDPPD